LENGRKKERKKKSDLTCGFSRASESLVASEASGASCAFVASVASVAFADLL
jgi:hypothetical protein